MPNGLILSGRVHGPMTVRSGTSANGPWRIRQTNVLTDDDLITVTLGDELPDTRPGDEVAYVLTIGVYRNAPDFRAVRQLDGGVTPVLASFGAPFEP